MTRKRKRKKPAPEATPQKRAAASARAKRPAKPKAGKAAKAEAGKAAKAETGKAVNAETAERAPKSRRKKTKKPPAPPVAKAPEPLEDLASQPGFDELVSEEVPELGIGSRVLPPPNVHYEADSPETTPRPSELSGNGDVGAQIRALEARLDGLIQDAASAPIEAPSPSSGPKLAPAADSAVEAPVAAPPSDLLSSKYYVQKWGRAGLRARVEEVDDFGLDPSYEQKVRPFVDFLYKRYFRARTEGIENIPNEGRCVIVANHSGALPLDGAMLKTAVRLEHPRSRELRWLAEDFVFYLPFAGVFMNRVGAVRACQENAERLLEKDALVAVFPEGIQGIKKHFRDRYRLQRFGRGGYIRLCLRMQAPLVPCAVIGAEEASPLIYRFETLSELLGLPYIPITPTFPWLGPLGLMPAPSKWVIKFGEPIHFDSYGPEAADDHLLVGRLSERVRAAIQGMLDSGLRERRSVWFG